MDKPVVITGATSMIGSAILEECLMRGVPRVYAVVRPDSPNASRVIEDSRVIPVECPADRYAELPSLVTEPCGAFFHVAWLATGAGRNADVAAQARNVAVTVCAVEAAAQLGCRIFIGAGSQAEYGVMSPGPTGPDDPVNPVQAYGVAKYAAGKLAAMRAEMLGISCAWVRVFSVYGKYEKPSTLVQTAVRKLSAGEGMFLTPAENNWDFLYSEDAGRAFCDIADHASGIKVYCLGSGESRPLRSYVEELRDIVDPDAELRFGALPYPGGAGLDLWADISMLTEDTGWVPRISFKEGVSRMLKG